MVSTGRAASANVSGAGPGIVNSGGGLESDGSRAPELADVVSCGGRVDAACVEARSRSQNGSRGPDSRCQMMTRMDRLIDDGPAPRRQRYGGNVARKSSVFRQPRRRCRHSGRVGVAVAGGGFAFLPADSFTPGASLTHDVRCPAVGNRSCPASQPGSRARQPGRGISSSRATASAKGATSVSILSPDWR